MVGHADVLSDVDRSLFPSSFTIRALRDSRYHNSAYAIAELIDNAIEAGAPHIELLCMEEPTPGQARTRRRVSEIAVLDNGPGMDMRTLLEALKFGGGTRHDSVRGIGKYGMGLPTSSMSQCKKVDVWTWQDGPSSVWHSSIDADAIERGDHLVPLPDQETALPDVWRRAGSDAMIQGRSGTLVVWSKLDKIQWKTSRGIIDNTSREVGRIHRHYIGAGIHEIKAAAFLKISPDALEQVTTFVANDPLYLMAPTSVPEPPWDEQPMFQQWGEPKYYTSTGEGGKEVTIEVKYSIVRPEALRTDGLSQNPGNTERGRHARHNIGVSVVREDREIVLEDAFLREGGSAENPQNRWWGCEVLFWRDSDDLFGVDHNKQMAANFTQAAKTLARDDRPNQVVLDELGIDDDLIYQIVGDIRDQTRAMMGQIRQMFAQKRTPAPRPGPGPSTPEHTAVKTATEADREAVSSGVELPTKTDIDRDQIPPEQREEGLTEQFVELGQAREDAQKLARHLVEEDLSYQFNSSQLDGSLMFNVRSNQAVLHINLNTDHPIYDLLSHIEGDLDSSLDPDDPAFQASVAIRLLLSSWARMEDQTEIREDRTRIQNIAINWGRHVEKVISHLRERSE